jgi:hypothetical protein
VGSTTAKTIMPVCGPRCSGFGPNGRGADYTDYPRGRVLYNSTEEIFLVYSSRAVVNNPGLRMMILAEFRLPLAATKLEPDYH